MAKGAVRDGDFKDKSPTKKSVRCYEDHPSKGKDVGRGTPQIKGKLGSS